MNDLAFALCEISLACLAVPRRALQRAEGVILRARRRLIGPLFVALAALMLATGCHGAERTTRTALDVVAESVVAADAIVADGYSRAAQRELDVASSLDDYRVRMARWDHAEEALRAIVPALYAAQAGLDAAGADGIRPALACVRVSVEQVIATLSAVDVPIPPALSRAVDAAGLFTGECR